MLGITKTITVARSAKCFLYLSDVRKLIEWDPAVSATRKDSQGPIAKGTYFTVRVAIGVLSVPFRYIITEHSPNRRIVIAGRSSFLNVNDTIELSESDGQTTISYRAEFHFKFGLERVFRDSPTHWTGNVSWRSMVWRVRLPRRLMKPF